MVRSDDSHHPSHVGQTSRTGSSLVKLGQAHCKIALAQEAFALTLQSSYLESLEVSAEEIREYEAERKALETRRYVRARCHPMFLRIESVLGSTMMPQSPLWRRCRQTRKPRTRTAARPRMNSSRPS